MSNFSKNEKQQHENENKEQRDKKKRQKAGEDLSFFIANDTLVGDLLSINYNNAVVLVHDRLRKDVGGLPMGCFLLASRINLEESANVDVEHEDTSLIFLRVIGNATLANHAKTEEYRLNAGFRSIGTPKEWDSNEKTDKFTLNDLRHAGVKCSVLGTFRMKKNGESWELAFGADISNFYSGQGMKVYKPMGESLKKIVNYTKPTGKRHDLTGHSMHIGHVRYSSSEANISKKIHVDVELEPTDLLARRTALFGMSRSGKSNTIKIIASSIFNLRETNKKGGRIGQLIFDINGEYCNINPQDTGCLRDVWKQTKSKKKEDVITYGWIDRQNEAELNHDTERRILKINFVGNEPKNWSNGESVAAAMDTLIAGKSLINNHLDLAGESAKYVKRFMETSLDVPLGKWRDYGARVRYKRAIIAYCSLLAKAGFSMNSKEVSIAKPKLFSEEFCKEFENPYPQSADTFRQDTASWDELSSAFSNLKEFIDSPAFKAFDSKQMQEKRKKKNLGGGDEDIASWADDTLAGILSLYQLHAGISRLRALKEQHSTQSESDYSVVITQDVRDGKLVIVDCSIGPEQSIEIVSNRIMKALFDAQKRDFVKPEWDGQNMVQPPDVVVYIEEAHNILPKTENNLSGIWPRIAKEGSKFHIGMVFSTQEPSSIMPNILKNTDNWFVAHLNNRAEVNELEKYYDFGEFADQILKVPDTGFLRMRCLSNPYIVPVQVKEFNAPTEEEEE